MLTGLWSALGLLPARHIQLPAIPGVPDNDPALHDVDARIDFYDYTARLAMNRYHFTRFLQLVFGAAIPVSQVIATGPGARISAAVLGAVVFIIQGMESYLHDAEHYPAYRAIAEQMKQERVLFSVKGGQYANPPPGKAALVLLVENVESMASQERQQWITTQQRSDTGQQPQQ
jgi:hypothetical protein